MSGGQLVVLDRLGRDVKRLTVAEGLVKLGSDESNDIRIMLDTVFPHHATVTVHANQTVVRNVCSGELAVNGAPVSVAALRHNDVLTVGGRRLRWEYSAGDTGHAPSHPALPELGAPVRRARSGRRGRASCPGAPAAPRRDRALEYALEASHRASMPGSAGGKQVAIVQPQRRDTSEHIEQPASRTSTVINTRPRTSKSDSEAPVSAAEADKTNRRSSLQTTTKATLWIESRKTSPRGAGRAPRRKSTPLRLTALRRAHGARGVTKIAAPHTIDHTKQAALLLMTGHTSKSRLLDVSLGDRCSVASSSSTPQHPPPKSKSSKGTPSVVTRKGSLVVKKKSPLFGRAVSASPRQRPVSTQRGNQSFRQTTRRSSPKVVLSESESGFSQNSGGSKSKRHSGQNSIGGKSTRRSSQKSVDGSLLLPSPKKSALKNPLSKRTMRKTESIKFDLSNLNSYSQDSDVLLLSDITQPTEAADSEFTLRYSPSPVQSPSPRRSIHSRSSRILERTLGSTVTLSPSSRTVNSESVRSRKSSRGSIIVQQVLNKSDEAVSYSRRTTKIFSDVGEDTVASAFRTRTLSPRTLTPRNLRNKLESYSIVDLVSVDSDKTGLSSVYNSADSTDTNSFVTPQNSVGRKTRSILDPILLGSSTPYVKVARMSSSSPNGNLTSDASGRQMSRRTKSLSTPQNNEHVLGDSTRVPRASRSRSRLKDSDLLLLETDDDSPKSSRRVSTASKRARSAPEALDTSVVSIASVGRSAPVNGTFTPENSRSPEDASTPVLSIQSLLDSSRNTPTSKSVKRGRPSFKRKTIGVISRPDKISVSPKSRSMNINLRMSRSKLTNDSYDNLNISNADDSEVVTPTSEVKLVPEGVKNKHSTAKKPQSKRSIIDDLNQSDIVKQLFNSPVKRKLSQSMTEFSRKHLFDDDVVQLKKPSRHTVAFTRVTPDNSMMDRSEAFSPEQFVSPMTTPSNSPNLDGIKRLFWKNTPENDLRDVRGVKALLRTPGARKSIRNDLTNVSGVKNIFSKNPTNRLSDVRVKEIFAASPNNDLRRISGVKTLFQLQQSRASPRNRLSDVRDVKGLFTRKSPNNDLGNVSGLKKFLHKDPKNDLTDVRGVKGLFKRKSPVNDLRRVSGVKKLMQRSPKNDLSDVRGVKRMFGWKKNELDDLSGVEELFNDEEWVTLPPRKPSHNSHSRELQKLVTDTVEGTTPIRISRVRNTTIVKTSIVEALERQGPVSEMHSSRKLPIKKRSLVNASIEQAKNSSKLLPLKKRAYDLLHSTPVKGIQGNVTMNASELGRVSPIVAENTQTMEQESSITSNLSTRTKKGKPTTRRTKTGQTPKLVKQSPKKYVKKSKATPKKDKSNTSKSTPSTEQSTQLLKVVLVDKDKLSSKGSIEHLKLPTPKDNSTSMPVTKSASPTKSASNINSKVTRSRRTAADLSSQHRSARKKKQPASMATAETVISKRTRATRKNDNAIEIVHTPKKTRAKAQKATVVVRKASPQMKPRSTRGRAAQNHSKTIKTTETVVESTKVSRKESPVKQNKRASLVVGKKTLTLTSQPRASRKRKQPETSLPEATTPKKTRATRNNTKIAENPKTRKNSTAKVQKATLVVKKTSTNAKPRSTKERIQKNHSDIAKHTQTTVKNKKISPRRSSPQKISSNKAVPKTRGRMTNSTTAEQTVTKSKRGRKPANNEESTQGDNKVKPDNEVTKTRKSAKKISNQTNNQNVEEAPKTRRNKVEQESVQKADTNTAIQRNRRQNIQNSTQPNLNATRARRDAKTNETVPPETNNRKRKSVTTDVRPTKVSKKEHVESGRRNKQTESPKTGIAAKEAPTKQYKGKKQSKGDASSKVTSSKKNEETNSEQQRSTRRTNPATVTQSTQRKRKNETVVLEEANKKRRGGKSPVKLAESPKRTRKTRAAAAVEASKTAGRSRRR